MLVDPAATNVVQLCVADTELLEHGLEFLTGVCSDG